MAQKLAGLTPFPLRHPVEANGVFVEMDEAALRRLHAAGWAAFQELEWLRTMFEKHDVDKNEMLDEGELGALLRDPLT